MTETTKDRHLTGYSIVIVYTPTVELHMTSPDKAVDAADVQFGWDWRRGDEDIFEVQIRLSMEPVKSRPYKANVVTVGRFRQTDENPSVSVEDFVALQAPAVILPYARQCLASLTAGTPFGAFHLPLINTSELMERFDLNAATGAKQALPALRKKRQREASPHK